jgi:hypothetical protein
MATATDENNYVNNTVCYDDVNRLIIIDEADSFDVDVFIKQTDFTKFDTINFNDCYILNKKYVISQLTHAFGAGLIIEGLYPFIYITKKDNDNQILHETTIDDGHTQLYEYTFEEDNKLVTYFHPHILKNEGSMCYDYMKRHIRINNNNCFDVNTFIKKTDFTKFDKIYFHNCDIMNNEYVLSQLTCASGAGLIIEGMFYFQYITTLDDIIDNDTKSITHFNSCTKYLDGMINLRISGMKSSEIPLFVLKLKHGLLVEKNVNRKFFDLYYVLIDKIEFSNDLMTDTEHKYLEEEISKSRIYYSPIVDMLNISALSDGRHTL